MIGNIRVGDLVKVHVGHSHVVPALVEEVVISRRDDDDVYVVRNIWGQASTVDGRYIGSLEGADRQAAITELRIAATHAVPSLRVLHETEDGGFITQGIVNRLRGNFS